MIAVGETFNALESFKILISEGCLSPLSNKEI